MWISVKDRLPDAGTSFLVYSPNYDENGDLITTATLEHVPDPENNLWFFVPSGYSFDGIITHWMTIPEKPR